MVPFCVAAVQRKGFPADMQVLAGPDIPDAFGSSWLDR